MATEKLPFTARLRPDKELLRIGKHVDPKRPTCERPDSVEKLAVLERRVRAGLPMWLHGDVTVDDIIVADEREDATVAEVVRGKAGYDERDIGKADEALTCVSDDVLDDLGWP